MRVEHEYDRGGAWAYHAAWDVHRAKVFGGCAPATGIAPFDRLVAQVMTQEPYRAASRVFWVVDNGPAHRGDRSIARLPAAWPTLALVHTPVHASWLNQIEIYFSILQRKVLTPNDFPSLARWRIGYSGSRHTTRRSPSRSSGGLRGTTCSRSSPGWRSGNSRCRWPRDSENTSP